MCGDNVYDLELEKIGVEQGIKSWKTLGEIQALRIRFERDWVCHSKFAGVLYRI